MITRKLRTRKPINYYEPEEPAHDAYEFCEQCNDFVENFCTLHGGLLVIPDDKVPTGKSRPALPRAMLTVPAAFLYIDSSSIPGAGLGVFAKETLPRGARFGPYRGRRRPAPASDYAWQVSGRGAHVCDAADATRSNWMRYVNCARHRREQNIIAYQYHGQIYYRTSQIISPGSELFVFYGSEFAAKLNIDLRNYNKNPAQHLRLIMGNVSRKHQDSDKRKSPTNTLADSLNATSAELRRVNACVMGMDDLGEHFNKPSDNYKQREIELISMLESINYLETINIERINKVNPVTDSHDEPNVSLANEDSLIILDNNDQEPNEKESKETENASKEKCDSTAKTWKCEACNELLSSRHQLRIHKRKHRQQKFSCGKCDYTTDAKHYYRRHELSHNKCKDNKLKAKKHNVIVTQLNNWQCEECARVFKVRAELRRHRRDHAAAAGAGAGPLLFKCEICEYRTDELFYFERHKRSYHRVPANILKCDRCNFSSVNPKAFKSHCALHGNAAAIRCDRCLYMSARARDMRAHFSRAHAQLRRVCRVCARAFSCDANLRRHFKTMHAKEVQ